MVDDLFSSLEEAPTLFEGFEWHVSAEIDGEPGSIFKWQLGVDPHTCDARTFLRGLLRCRVNSASGRVASLRADDLLYICSKRADLALTKQSVKTLVAELKQSEDFTATALKKLRLNYPTLSVYTEQHMEKLAAFRSLRVEGDSLDAVFSIARGEQPPPEPPPAETPPPAAPPAAPPAETAPVLDRLAAARRRLGL